MTKKANVKLTSTAFGASDKNIKTLNAIVKDKNIDVENKSAAIRFCIELAEKDRANARKAARAAKGKK